MSSKTCNHPKLTRKKVPDYSTDEFGIPLRLVDAVEEEVCEECGARIVFAVENTVGLVAAAAIARATHPQKLSGREIKFLRKALKWSAKQLGEVLDSKPETVSRWENGKLPMSSNSEKLLRLLTCSTLGPHAPGISYVLDEILQMHISPVHDTRQDDVRLCLQRVLCINPPNKVPTAAYIKVTSEIQLLAA